MVRGVATVMREETSQGGACSLGLAGGIECLENDPEDEN